MGSTFSFSFWSPFLSSSHSSSSCASSESLSFSENYNTSRKRGEGGGRDSRRENILKSSEERNFENENQNLIAPGRATSSILKKNSKGKKQRSRRKQRKARKKKKQLTSLSQETNKNLFPSENIGKSSASTSMDNSKSCENTDEAQGATGSLFGESMRRAAEAILPLPTMTAVGSETNNSTNTRASSTSFDSSKIRGKSESDDFLDGSSRSCPSETFKDQEYTEHDLMELNKVTTIDMDSPSQISSSTSAPSDQPTSSLEHQQKKRRASSIISIGEASVEHSIHETKDKGEIPKLSRSPLKSSRVAKPNKEIEKVENFSSFSSSTSIVSSCSSRGSYHPQPSVASLPHSNYMSSDRTKVNMMTSSGRTIPCFPPYIPKLACDSEEDMETEERMTSKCSDSEVLKLPSSKDNNDQISASNEIGCENKRISFSSFIFPCTLRRAFFPEEHHSRQHTSHSLPLPPHQLQYNQVKHQNKQSSSHQQLMTTNHQLQIQQQMRVRLQQQQHMGMTMPGLQALLTGTGDNQNFSSSNASSPSLHHKSNGGNKASPSPGLVFTPSGATVPTSPVRATSSRNLMRSCNDSLNSERNDDQTKEMDTSPKRNRLGIEPFPKSNVGSFSGNDLHGTANEDESTASDLFKGKSKEKTPAKISQMSSAARKSTSNIKKNSSKTFPSKPPVRRGRQPKQTRGVKSLKIDSGKQKQQRAAQQASLPAERDPKSSLNPARTIEAKQTRDTSPPPTVRMIHGTKVTMIDEAKKVFTIDLLSPETCEFIRQMVERHVEEIEASGDKDIPIWRTLYTYTKMDLPCSEVKNLASRVTNPIMSDIIKVVGVIFGKRKEAAKLRPRSWKEPHLLKYQVIDGLPHHTGVEMHYDGCDITWQVMLTRADEYEGGGTYIRCLRKTVKLKQGQVIVHPGELYHKGVDITAGVRMLIVGFMDGFDPKILDESQQSEDREEYEKNVRFY